MHSKNAPTYKFRTELIFNDFVTFEENKVLLSELTPKPVAILLYLIEPKDVKIVYHMSNPVCKCGGKLHKHQLGIGKWISSILLVNINISVVNAVKQL